MNKEQAIAIAKIYLQQKNTTPPVSIDSTEILDEAPTEFKDYWCFRAYYEYLDPRRPDGVQWGGVYPYYLVEKKTGETLPITTDQHQKLKK